MANLNIIGNGFDLYHGLPTSYYHFACYMLSTNEELYDELAEMYSFSKGEMHHSTGKLERKIDDLGYWSEFEKNLGNLWVEGLLIDDLDLECPDAVDLCIGCPDYSDTIKEILKKWITSTTDTKKNFEIIKKVIGKKKVDFSSEDVFISFNYTHTLEEVYDISNVLHIHGEANLVAHKNDLIIGHGNNKILDDLQDRIVRLDGNDYDQPSRNRKLEYQFAKEVLKKLRKPVEICMEQLSSFINKIEEPDYICVYGFSLGDVDLLYMQLIREKFPICKWRFSYYSKCDIAKIKMFASSLKIDNTQYELFEFKNLDSCRIETELIKKNKIVIFPKMKK